MRKRLCLLLLLNVWCVTLHAATVVFLGPASDSDLFSEAFRHMNLPKEIAFEFHCVAVDSMPAILDSVKRADILILNARSGELREIARKELDPSKTKLYALSSRLLDRDTSAQEPPELMAYRANNRPENFRNMVFWIVHRELDSSVKFAPPVSLPESGATHPAADKVFPSLAEYRHWAKENGHFHPEGALIAFAVHAASVNRNEMKLFRSVTDECEKQGLNVVIVYGDEVQVIRKLLLTPHGTAAADAVLALSFKFKSGLGEELRHALKDLDVPVFNALRLYRQTTREWADSVRGMNDFSVTFGFVAPEISGMIEPSLLFGSRMEQDENGRKIQSAEPFPEQIRNTVSRLKKWTDLRRKGNAEKHIAIFLYNGSGGKQNIGASGLNVPGSLVRIVAALSRKGYRTAGLEKLDESALTGELLKHARNIGSWAPGELDELIANGGVFRLPKQKYIQWFAELPETFRQSVTAEWGTPEQAEIMVSGNDFILPMLKRGNLVLLPEPMRGWLDDPHKLVHSATLAPPHQYLAVYLWLRHEFRADAMIHLGRHGSSEWLPGKQLGLSSSDAPMIVRGNIPEIYPYISDGIGEGIVAKRRAQAVMIDHLPPALKIPLSEDFLPDLKQKLSDCRTAVPSVREPRERALRQFAHEKGLSERLDLSSPGWLQRVETYVENRLAPTPFGLHSFGKTPSDDEIRSLLRLLPEKERADAELHLKNAGRDEMNALLHALDGGFVEPGPSGDPLRNPRVLPVGRNFYSFDPAKIPTADAMKTGAELAKELLAREKLKLGRVPRSVAVILWAGETVRNDGVNEAMILSLMGMTVLYDRAGRVAGVVPVPGAQLEHPRIDVLITASGAYRDQFGDLIRLLEKAHRQAGRLNDAENFIRRGAPGIFFPAPGTYGTRVNKLAGASGIWEKDDELAAVYLRNMAYTVDEQGAFTENRPALSDALKNVETILHSRSGNVYGVTDIDDMYQYLGGLSLAVKKSSGRAPGTYIADQRKRSGGTISDLKSFMAGELDSRIRNREWILAMMLEHYAGARTLARTTDNLWGWQAVAPETLSASDWTKLYEIYVLDSYQLNMKEFFARNSEWAFQSMTGRMLEAVRKQYWSPSLRTKQSLASEYARSVIRQGMACCDHTCNNPLLNQMVVSLISMPGVLSPDMVMKFQAAVEKSAGKTLGDQVRERRELQKTLASSFGKHRTRNAKAQSAQTGQQTEQARNPGNAEPVKGFKMKPSAAAAEKTSLSSSGIKWTILAAVFLLIGIFALGGMRKEP